MKGNAYVPFMLRRGDGSTLSLDFTAMGSLDSRFTFTRSTTATFINSSGYVESIGAAASNDPTKARFDYDPTTLTARGLLIEGAATNHFFHSNPIATTGSYWGSGGYTLGTGATSPDGTNTSTRLTVNSNSGATCSMQQSVTMNATSCTFSIWFKNGTLTGSSNVALTSVAVRNATTATILLRFYFNATNPSSITYVTGSTGASVVAYANGWYRISATVTSGVTSGNSITGYFAGLGSGINGELNNYADWWGPQMEQGTAASSFIPTVASQFQRTADTCIASSTGFSSWFTGGTSGTFYADWYGGVRGITSTVRTVLSTSDITARHLHLQQTAAAGNLKVADFGAANVVTTSNSLTSGARTKGAFSFSGSTVNLTLNGGTVATSSSIAFSTAPTYLVLGGTSTDGTTITDATVLLNGSIRAIKYWPSVLPTATLQSLTA
jgi:hypothetical protein